MRVLVTGGAGFIGSHLVDQLVQGRHDIMIIDDLSTGDLGNLRDAMRVGLSSRRIVDISIADPRVPPIVAEFRPVVMMLLAAQSRVNVSMRDPRLDLHVNLTGLLNLLEASRHAGVRKVVFASSGGTIYGSTGSSGDPVAEDAPKTPASFYGLTKLVGGEYLRLYREAFGLEYVALALGNVYGERQRPDGESGVIARFADRLSRGEPCVINGDGRTTRDYVHVSDVVRALVLSLTHGQGLINIGTGVGTSVNEVYRQLAARFGVTAPPMYGPAKPGEARHIVLDPGLAQTLLGWRAQTLLDVGIRTFAESVAATVLGDAVASQQGRREPGAFAGRFGGSGSPLE